MTIILPVLPMLLLLLMEIMVAVMSPKRLTSACMQSCHVGGRRVLGDDGGSGSDNGSGGDCMCAAFLWR